MSARRVLVTGAEGTIGTAVREHLGDRYELRSLTLASQDFPSHVADTAELDAILEPHLDPRPSAVLGDVARCGVDRAGSHQLAERSHLPFAAERLVAREIRHDRAGRDRVRAAFRHGGQVARGDEVDATSRRSSRLVTRGACCSTGRLERDEE